LLLTNGEEKHKSDVTELPSPDFAADPGEFDDNAETSNPDFQQWESAFETGLENTAPVGHKSPEQGEVIEY
ncbi:hypothetical protein E4U50_000568, partial [Claviceps purpurea]